MLNQTVLFISAQTALAHRPHDNPKSRLSGTAPNIITDVYAWLAFYAASGIGWLLFASLPGIVASFKTYSAKRHANALRSRLEELKEEWGEEISGNVPESQQEGEEASEVSETEAAPA
jgi:hypothetical protein